MMNNQEFVERRRKNRYGVKFGSFVLFNGPSSRLCRMIDISRDGASFLYHMIADENMDSFSEIDIIIPSDGYYLENIPVKLVSDVKIPHEKPNYNPINKRVCLQFNDLPSETKEQISHIIQHHTKDFAPDRRSGSDRRLKKERRKTTVLKSPVFESRDCLERRNGLERRKTAE